MAGVRDNTVSNIVSGGIASFKSVGQVPLKSLKVNFNPIQEGDGDPSPSNIRPISGWTGCNLWRTGKNLYGGGNADRARYPLFLKKGTKVTVSIDNTDSRVNIIYYRKDASQIDYWTISELTGTRKYKTFTLIEDAYYFSFADHNYVGNIIHNTMIELGSTISTYEPYNGTTVPVSWSNLGTVYGGYVDLISGEVWQGWEVASARWGDIKTGSPNTTTGYYQGKLRFTNKITILHDPSYYGSFTFSNVINKVSWNGPNTTPEHYYGGNENEKGVCYISCNYDDDITIQIAAKLATPILIGIIDPITIKSLIGQNNIWSNADTVEAQYCALESLDIYKQRFKTNEPHLQSANRNIVSFQTDMVAPLKECKVYFQPVQASGTPSPDNVLPISGWNSITIQHTDNLWDGQYQRGKLDNNGANTYASVEYRSINYIPVIPGSTIHIKFTPTSSSVSNLRLYCYSNTKEYIRNTWKNPSNYTLGSDVYYIRFYVDTGYSNIYNGKDIVIQYVSNINSNIITLPSTYYGGYVDITTGEGSITKGITTITTVNGMAGDESNTGFSYPYSNIINGCKKYSQSEFPDSLICDKIKTESTTSWRPLNVYEGYINNGARMMWSLPGEYNTKELAQDWLDNIGGLQVVFDLETPIPFTLTPTQLKTLKNQNNIWSNTNGITQVKYWTHGSIADKRKVVWNNLAWPLEDTYYVAYNTNYANITFNNGEATSTQIAETALIYQTDIRSKNRINSTTGHIIYTRQEINPSTSGSYNMTVEEGTAWGQVDSNIWSTLRGIRKITGSNMPYIYLGRPNTLKAIGNIIRSRNPLIVDLTLMFGEGNQPSTATEFEALCVRNGVDLTQPQPYNATGTEMYWYF